MIKLTLEVTSIQLLQIAKLLDTSSEVHTEPTPVEVTRDNQTLKQAIEVLTKPVVTKPTAKSKGTGPKLPAFGRSQQQVDDYSNSESSRIEALDIKEEEKALKQEAKDALEEVAKKEVKAIKELKIVKEELPTTLPRKSPWAD